ncbi:hypothetical protein FSP39_019514 [Pinctada imbricata]|uniref:Uncharacterized protein n=1 Tax=Pinctada imbricata TaxID=66713 RepID=A0AA89BI84_PINIB|nr:hypothetical protein FSP39_019514 [Pinctada imbricata]
MVDRKNDNLDCLSIKCDDVIKVKVVVIGDVSVGKTSLATRFTKQVFDERASHTIGASYYVRTIEIEDRRVLFQIWDTAGQERFRSLVPMYLRDTKIAIIVYDISSKKSFESMDHWKRELSASAPSDTIVALVGNKCDLHLKREVDSKHGRAYATRHGMMFLETSAKLGTNIDELFHHLVSVAENTLSFSSLDKTPIDVRRITRPINISPKEEETKSRCCRSGH